MAVYAYCRASTDQQSASPETQMRTINEYCARQGFTLDGCYIDPEISGKVNIFKRDAGKELMFRLKKGDIIVVAMLDRLNRSFLNFTEILEHLMNRGVALHACDLPGGAIDPKSPISIMIARILAIFAEYERQCISARTKEGLATYRAQGKRFGGRAPYGFKWQRAGFDRKKSKYQWIMVPDERERIIMRKAVAMRLANYTYDQIRQYFSFEWKVTTRTGNAWQIDGVRSMCIAAFKLFASEEVNDCIPDMAPPGLDVNELFEGEEQVDFKEVEGDEDLDD